MKFQFNKEFVIKHRFWLMLGSVVPLALVGLVVLGAAAGQIAKLRADIIADAKKVDDAGQGGRFSNHDTIKEISKKGEEIGSKKFEVWQKAYNEQKQNFIWPKELEDLFHFATGKFALEINVEDRKAAPDYKALPEDTPELVHGQVVRISKDTVEVRDRKNQVHVFYDTPQIKVEIAGSDKKDYFFNDIRSLDHVKVKYQVGKSFGDPLTVSEQNLYTKVYLSQIPSLFDQLQPVDRRGKGVVQFPNSYTYSKDEPPPNNGPFFYYVPGDWKITRDISEEAWLAQEDLWIQRELLRLVRMANDYVSVFKGEGGEVKDKEYTFANPYWNMTLKWSGGAKLIVKLDNLLNRRQKLDQVKFRIRTNKNKVFDPELVEVSGEPLGPRGFENDSITQVVTLPPGVNRTGIYKVEQVLDWETAAVRRIDQVAFGGLGGMALCHRLAGMPLLPYKEDAAAEGAGGGAAPGGGGAAPPAGDKGAFAPGMFGKQNAKMQLPNGLIKERYIEVQQGKFRRLPVGLALIVDQDHVDRVQAAFNNSVFRFMTTQVIINRYAGSLRPQVVAEASSFNPGEFELRKPGDLPGPGFDPKGKGGPKFKGFPPATGSKGKVPMAEVPMPGGTGDLAKGIAGEDLETNVELIIYGIITIYEQPRMQTASAEAPGGAPGATPAPDKKPGSNKK